jgi:hypothetical protein
MSFFPPTRPKRGFASLGLSFYPLLFKEVLEALPLWVGGWERNKTYVENGGGEVK